MKLLLEDVEDGLFGTWIVDGKSDMVKTASKGGGGKPVGEGGGDGAGIVLEDATAPCAEHKRGTSPTVSVQEAI